MSEQTLNPDVAPGDGTAESVIERIMQNQQARTPQPEQKPPEPNSEDEGDDETEDESTLEDGTDDGGEAEQGAEDDETAEAEDGDDEEGDEESDEDEDSSDEPAIEIDGKKRTAAEVKQMLDGMANKHSQRMQELSEKERQFDAAVQYVATEAKQLMESLQSRMPKKPDRALAKEDPWTYQEQLAEYEEWAEDFQKAQTLAQQSEQQSLTQAKQNTYTTLQTEWGDSYQSRLKELESYIPESGIPQESWGYVDTDPVYMQLLWKASQYDKISAEQPKAKAKAKDKPKPKASKPGRKQTRASRQQQSRDAARKRLSSEKSVDAAVDWLMEKR